MVPTSRQTANEYSAELANRFCGIRANKSNSRIEQILTGAALAAARNRESQMFQGTIDTGSALPIEATANGDILFELGMIYSTGRSGLIDLVAAHKWFNLAALKGRVDAISLRQEIAGLMSDVEIATAQREARAWIATH